MIASRFDASIMNSDEEIKQFDHDDHAHGRILDDRAGDGLC